MNNHYKVIADAIKNNDNLHGEAKFDLMLDLTEDLSYKTKDLIQSSLCLLAMTKI